MKKSKKRKIRKKRIVLLSVILLLGISVLFISKEKEKEKSILTKSYISDILAYQNEDMNEDFLEWIQEEYGNDVLEKIFLSLKENQYDRALWHTYTGNSYIVLQDYYQGVYEDNPYVTVKEIEGDTATISFAGDVSLADNWEIMPYYYSRNQKVYGILSEDTVQYMNETDIMIVNSEFSFSNRGTPLANKKYTFRANPQNVSVYQEMGVDLVTLANNHVYDYGEDAFLDTLDTLDSIHMPRIGAGKNIEEAKQAYYFVITGYKIAFVNATRAEKYILTPEATETTSGVFRAYDPTEFANTISKEKENSDYVVALIHWGTEDTHELEQVQLDTGKLYIDSGADLVVGTHAHVLQGVEFYNEKLIAYNLGDYIFSKGTKDTGILTWKLKSDGTSEYQFIPGIQENNKTSLVYGNAAQSVYDKMTTWSINAEFQENGEIIEKNL